MRLINTKTLKLEEFPDSKIPPYAILSHTWGNNWEELTFRDVESGRIDKPGVGSIKLRGCCSQAAKDGLGYAWIDTCCIDKTNLVELSEAINSMFRWYNRASVCYAYLSDVSDDDDPRGAKFQTSRWFRRGWTLQELLAPKHLQFYNSTWRHIGNKGTRRSIIKDITGVPPQFLLGITELHYASVAQRMSWAAQRETTRAEDLAYCLLGIFGVTMPMIYGEGGDQAFFRLQEQIMKTTRDDSILAWGLVSNEINEPSMSGPGQVIGGGVLAAAPSSFANSGQVLIREQTTNHLQPLDIFGGSLRIYLQLFTTPYGETFGLLNCGPGPKTQQAVGIPLVKTHSGIPNEYVRPRGRASVLWPVAAYDASPELIYIKKDGQKSMSANTNQQYWLYEDDLFAQFNLTLIEVEPRSCWNKEMALILPKNDSRDGAADQILTRFRHGMEGSRDFVIVLTFRHSDAPVEPQCNIMVCSRYTPLEELAGKLQYMTLGVSGETSASNGSLHLRVILELVEGEMISLKPETLLHPPDCTIDATMEMEKTTLILDSTQLLKERGQNCAKEEELNQRAKDFSDGLNLIKERREEVENELERLEKERGRLVEEEHNKTQEMDLLAEEQTKTKERQAYISKQLAHAQKRLAELHGTDGSKNGWTPFRWAVENGDVAGVSLFLDRAAYKGAVADSSGWIPLIAASSNGNVDVVRLLLDMGKVDINSSDNEGRTSLYWASANGHRAVVQLLLDKGADVGCQLTLQGHKDRVSAVAFSHDSKLMVSGSHDGDIKLWDAVTGQCQRTIQGHGSKISSMVVSNDSKVIVSGFDDGFIKLWDSATGACQQSINGLNKYFNPVAISHDSKLLLSGSSDYMIKLWDSTTGQCLQAFQGHKSSIISVAFSHDSTLVIAGCYDGSIKLWNIVTGQFQQTLQGHGKCVNSVTFSHNSKLVVSGSDDKTAKIWDCTTGQCRQTLQNPHYSINSVAFSHDSKLIVSGSSDYFIKLWDSATGQCLQTLNDHKGAIYSVAFSYDSKLVVSGSNDNTLKLWDSSIANNLVASPLDQDQHSNGYAEKPETASADGEGESRDPTE
ncbi:hypothetical protein V8C37DRAFT_72631 [Trichoderma ceciliae]